MHSASERAPTPVGSKVWIFSSTSSHIDRIGAEVGGELLDRRVLDVAVGVDVAEDRHPDLEPLGRQVGHLELPREVVVQARRPGQRLLERRHLFAIAAEARHRRAGLVAVEVVLPVDLVDRARVALDLGLGDAVDHRALDRGLGRVALVLELLGDLLVGADGVEVRAALVLEVHLVVEDGVLEHLLMHELGQLHARELQQADRLLQLRSHHELLRELQLLPHLHSHDFSLTFALLDRIDSARTGIGTSLEVSVRRPVAVCKGRWPASC